MFTGNYIVEKAAGRDVEVPSPPGDSVSFLEWSAPDTMDNFLAAGSWDGEVRIWQVGGSGIAPKASTKHEGPVLCASWYHDGTKLFTGDATNKGVMWDLTTNAKQPVAQHDDAIKEAFWIKEMNLLCTGGWDRNLRYWDLRQPKPAASITLTERVYTMDVRYPLSVVGLAERQIYIFNLNNPGTPFDTVSSALQYQTRCIATFPDQSGFAVGSIEGRVSIQHVAAHQRKMDFAFKCHRKDQKLPGQKDKMTSVYSVNEISFHPLSTFATCGADGSFHFWDKDSKMKLKNFPERGRKGNPSKYFPWPVSCGKFNKDGSIYAYCYCYDWSQGHERYPAGGDKPRIFLHPVQENEVKPKKK